MLSLATVGQSGARAVAMSSRVRLMKADKCCFIPKKTHRWHLFSCSDQYRCFTASTSQWNQKTPSYSYVVVGAGSAGCVLANRLTEDAHESVLLLEAGPKDKWFGSLRLSWKIHMPAALTYNLCDNKYWLLSLFFFFASSKI